MKIKKTIGIVALLLIGIMFEVVISVTIFSALNTHAYVKFANWIYQTVVICVVTFVMIKFFHDSGAKLMSIKKDDKGKNKIEYKKWFIAIIIIIFLYIPVLSQFCPQIFSIFHFKTSDSPTWIGYWGNILGSVLGIVGAFVVSAKYADNGDKKEGPRGPEGPEGPRGPRGPEGPSGSPSDYSGIIEAINQINMSIEKNRKYNYGHYRNERALHRYVHRLIDLKRKYNDVNDIQKEDFLKDLVNFIHNTRSINYYNGTPMYREIKNLINDNRNVYSADEINRLIDDLIYYLF